MVAELESSLAACRTALEEKSNRVTELETEEDRMANCIVELEQKCGAEKCKLSAMSDRFAQSGERIQKLIDADEVNLKKIDDLEDASTYDKEHIVKLESEISNLKQAKSKLEADKLNIN